MQSCGFDKGFSQNRIFFKRNRDNKLSKHFFKREEIEPFLATYGGLHKIDK